MSRIIPKLAALVRGMIHWVFPGYLAHAIGILTILVFWPTVSSSGTGPRGDSAICDQAASIAASESTVPLSVLRAVARTETGRSKNGRLDPWPWTVNMQGAGHWFSSQDEARKFVFRHFKAGARSFDVGCFQINFKWHHQAFQSLDDMFDPVTNARYAARFLTELFDELGSWDAAVGAFHSRTPALADKYLTRYKRIHSTLVHSDPFPGPDSAAPERIERAVPFLPHRSAAGIATAQLGSLVTVGKPSAAPLFEANRAPLITK